MTIISGLCSAPGTKVAMPDTLAAKSQELIIAADNDPITSLLELTILYKSHLPKLPEEKPKKVIGKSDLDKPRHNEEKLI